MRITRTPFVVFPPFENSCFVVPSPTLPPEA
jgi:hypothetical protein